ncbi:hypothetical protein PsAD13_03209 [Pseudovibrio sp. Ad13]|uniref:hypothetical protein n=1 Tax=Pseudovibrio sp. Ad13 TaxID=989396 RepID=UPI0007AE5DA0|nr:hypothetical protein [Pseudovibrio sp. Ad13]KZK83007.1 hypothetical protein PsAD13_03209 [Pseudovibrio sp. Ad13]
MTLPKSDAEKEIREATVLRLRELRPQGRIIHEMNIMGGQHRIDLACVSPDEIIFAELKSQRDKIDRLNDQAHASRLCAHHSIAVLHEKFFERRHSAPTDWSKSYVYIGHKHEKQTWLHFKWAEFWPYPALPAGHDLHHRSDKWNLDKASRWDMPPAENLMDLLWTEEQKRLAQALGVSLKGCTQKAQRARRVAFHATGEQITREVCRQLRAREFAHADAPIFDDMRKAA